MRIFSSLDLTQAHPWSEALFTTYALGLSFFEAVVLDVLVRKSIERTLILADIEEYARPSPSMARDATGGYKKSSQWLLNTGASMRN